EVEVSSPISGMIYDTNQVVVAGSVTDDAPSSGIKGVWVNGATASITGTNWTVTLTGLSEGSVTIDAIVYDDAGNEGVVAVNITIDTLPPAVSITSPTDGWTFNQATILVKGSATDDTTEIARVEVNTQTASGTEDWMITISSLTEGVNLLEATAWDEAGNWSSTSISVYVDSTAPGVPVITSPAAGDTNINSFAVAGSAEVGATVEVFADAVSLGTVLATGGTFSLTTPA
ncbi:unnamed protein product, partial [marine sediment metagenome]